MEQAKILQETRTKFDHKIVGYIKSKLLYNFSLPQENMLLLQSAEKELKNS